MVEDAPDVPVRPHQLGGTARSRRKDGVHLLHNKHVVQPHIAGPGVARVLQILQRALLAVQVIRLITVFPQQRAGIQHACHIPIGIRRVLDNEV